MFGKNVYLSDNKRINYFCEIFFNTETGFSYIKIKWIKKSRFEKNRITLVAC